MDILSVANGFSQFVPCILILCLLVNKNFNIVEFINFFLHDFFFLYLIEEILPYAKSLKYFSILLLTMS